MASPYIAPRSFSAALPTLNIREALETDTKGEASGGGQSGEQRVNSEARCLKSEAVGAVVWLLQPRIGPQNRS